MSATTSDSPSFSLAEARSIVRDLFTPREWLYWLDFLTTFFVGQLGFGLTRFLYDMQLEPLWLRLILQLFTFTIQCVCFFRAVMFIHEIVHLPERRFRAFRVVWNLLCGIPFLLPAFTYQAHLDHHRRTLFGTVHDGEYLPLASLAPRYIVLYLAHCLVVPLVVLVRFGVLTPLLWLSPRLRSWTYRHLSSLVMDPRYLRPAPTADDMRSIQLQELGCCLFIWGVAAVVPLVLKRPLLVLAVHAYLTAVVLIFMNSVRTLASHRFWGDGREATFVEQMLDSITLDNDSPLAVLINPVGLRYHATHHLFPSLPYHNLRAAHRRLLAQLPADSPYRQTVERSLLSVVRNLWQRAANNQQPWRGVGVSPARTGCRVASSQ